MPVITISREFGSEGDAVASRVADALGYHFVDQKFIGTILGQYGYVEFDKEYVTLPTFWERFDAQREKNRDVMVNLLNQVTRAVARHGNVVLLGRSGFEVLKGFADVLHVRLQAPFLVRVRRVMTQRRIALQDAEALVRETDKVRIGFVEEFYQVAWNSMQAFDLVINTGMISPETAAELIIRAARTFQAEPETGLLTVASIDVERIMAEAVSTELHCQLNHA